MSKRRNPGDIIVKLPYAGFVGQTAYAVIQEEDTDDHIPCMLDCGDPECVEWIDVFLLPGDSMAEATEALKREEYLGSAYHVSECQMADDAGHTGATG